MPQKKPEERTVFLLYLIVLPSLQKCLFATLLFPIVSVGQQQVLIHKVHDAAQRSFFSSLVAESDSNQYTPFYYLPDAAAFYKGKKVKKIQVADINGVPHFTLWLDRNGHISQSRSTEGQRIFIERFQDGFYSRSLFLQNGRNPQLLDSLASKATTYSNKDTTITFYQNTLYTYKSGRQINARNASYNEANKRRDTSDFFKDGYMVVYDPGMNRLFAVNYTPDQFYKCSEKSECCWRIQTKNNSFYGNAEDPELYFHPFIYPSYAPDCTNWFVDGENIEAPHVTYSAFRPQTNFCGTGAAQLQELEELRKESARFTFEINTRNHKGLNDTALLYYYPVASLEEVLKGLYFEGADPAKKSGVPCSKTSRQLRSLTPQRTALYTLHYEYYTP